MAVMARREGETPLTGRVEMDDAYLGGVRSGGKRGRGAAGKTPFVAAVSTSPAPLGGSGNRHEPRGVPPADDGAGCRPHCRGQLSHGYGYARPVPQVAQCRGVFRAYPEASSIGRGGPLGTHQLGNYGPYLTGPALFRTLTSCCPSFWTSYWASLPLFGGGVG